MDIKETKETLKALGMLAGEVHEITKDGLSWSDLNSLVDMANDFQFYKDGVEGISKIKNEVKDLNQAELASLMLALFEGFEKGKK